MYSSLDRIDIVLGKDGQDQEYVQTDHRTTEEIEAEPELSVLFALVRILNPQRMARENSRQGTVHYQCFQPPPEFLVRAIRAAGARLTVGDRLEPVPEEGAAPVLVEVAAEAFAGLAARTAAEHGVEVNLAGLQTIEEELAGGDLDPEEDEIAYWTAVMQLGAFAGEVIRASNGGHWEIVDTGTLPFALETTFQGSEATVNPLGKAIKRFANGAEDCVASLVEMVCGRA
jgi:hypothetical protein